MAELKLETDSYPFDSLEKKYAQFFAPAAVVKVNGSKIDDSIPLSMVRVETTTEATADSFLIRVTNAYEWDSGSWKWLNVFQLGASIDISLGYLDKLELVFSGYITSVTVEFMENDGGVVNVRGMDLSFFMMKGTRMQTWNDKKYSDVVKEIASRHKATAHVDDTTIQLPTISQNMMDDFHYIQHLAGLLNYDFFVVGKHLYFRKPLTQMTPVTTLALGKELRALSIEHNLAEQLTGVKIRFWDDKEQKVVQSEAGSITKLGSNSKTGKDVLSKIGDYTETLYMNASSNDEAKNYADAYLNHRSMKLVTGHAECIGIPEIRAGRYLKLSGVGDTYNQTYYITSASHVLDDDGYVTRFQLGGNAV
ncbi:phage late control D family protein [Paenibacillus oceani]|uniref:Phage late control D family protein n=1 Tax=Paenibacillus oceani TaxID=2772510 RepID=A0A927CBH8_9BACL|nr:phage late control D family protein [Paenibacillus oceani]MBD2865004.1 phage late control D family protein [Paenibacillus oceani]